MSKTPFVGYLAGIASVALTTIRASVFKGSKVNVLNLIALNAIGMLILSYVLVWYEADTGAYKPISPDASKFGLTNDPFKNPYLPKTAGLSLLSQFRYLTQFTGVSILPISVSVPLLTLTVISSLIFNKLLRDDPIRPIQYVAVFISFIGAVMINLHRILGHGGLMEDIAHHHYIFGIVLMLISVTLNGFLITEFKTMTDEVPPSQTMLNESAVAGIFMFVVLMVYLVIPGSTLKRLFGVTKKTPMGGTWIWLLIFFTFLGGMAIFTRLTTLSNLPEIVAIVLLNLKSVMAIFVGYAVFGEKIGWNKIVGTLMLLGAVILSQVKL